MKPFVSVYKCDISFSITDYFFCAPFAIVARRSSAAFLIAGLIMALIWFGDPTLAAIFGAAMVINLLAAAFAGLLIPLAIDKIGWDPAISSGVFLTTVTDVVGFFAFLGLAVVYL